MTTTPINPSRAVPFYCTTHKTGGHHEIVQEVINYSNSKVYMVVYSLTGLRRSDMNSVERPCALCVGHGERKGKRYVARRGRLD